MFWGRKNKAKQNNKSAKKQENSETEKKVFIFKEKEKVVLIRKKGDETKIARSDDGFEFEIDQYEPLGKKIKEDRERKEQLRNKYLNSIVEGSENINPDDIEIQNAFQTEHGHLLFYHHHDGKNQYQVGALLFNNEDNPIWRHSHPIWHSPESWTDDKHQFINLIYFDNRYISYWHSEKEGIFASIYSDFNIGLITKEAQELKISKHHKNPLITPKQDNDWEAFNTFNPAAVYVGDKVHILYRAQGYDYISSVGYANSNNGVDINERLDHPIFAPNIPFDEKRQQNFINRDYVSGGGCGGCEDPRTTVIDDRVYMTYVYFDGFSPPRIAITSISVENFLNKRWLWEKPVLISPPGVVDKSACILPEKINGKYVIFHRIFPNILIDFVDSLDFSDGQYLKGQYKITPRSQLWWDSRKIGAGAPPLKTKDGWLLIYQAVDDKDSGKYLVGAMLLDLEDPTKVLYRSKSPIIEPDMWYDNEGFKAGVVYPCGAVIVDDQLFVYYGGADSHVCVANTPLDKFLQQLKTTGKPEIEPAKIKKDD